jgi:hypothetical protein
LGGLLISLMVVALPGFMLRHGHASFRSEPLGK